jgi:hypothetical protein
MRLVDFSVTFMLSLLFTIAVKSNQKGLGLFLCLWKLQKRFLHAKQTVSLVLYSFILASPLFCFLTFIKSRPFSNYQVTVFIKIWIVNFEILNMKSGPRFTAHHSLLISALGLIKFSIQWLWSIATNPSLELTFKCGFDTIFQKKNHSATGSPLTTDWQQTTDNGEHTTHHSLLHHYTITPVHNPPLTIPVTSSLPAYLGRQVIFDRKLYREVFWSYEISLSL